MEQLEAQYLSIVDQVHRFDLQQTSDEAVDILATLGEIFEEARRARDRQNAN